MKGYVDSFAGQIVTGDTIIDPHSGVLCKVESVTPQNEKGLVVLDMRGSVSQSYMGLVCKSDRVLRRAPRRDEITLYGAPRRAHCAQDNRRPK
jgi:hypothetical protein